MGGAYWDNSNGIGGAIIGGTPGSILFVDSSGNLGQNNASLFWDSTHFALTAGGADPDGGPIRIHNFGLTNTFVGYNAGNFTLTASHGVSGFSNTGFGTSALANLTTGYNNAAFGYALPFCSTGFQNTAIGDDAMQILTTSHDNTSCGYNTLTAITTTAKSNFNCAFGSQALQNKTDNTCSAFGMSAGLNDLTGSGNTYIGYFAGNANQAGNGVTAIGDAALQNCTNSWNTAIGSGAGNGQTNATANTYLGYFSGLTLTAANKNITGSNNTWVGYNTGPSVVTQLSNACSFGANAQCSASNQMVLGSGITDIVIPAAAALEWGAPGSADLFLLRDAANTLAQRNGTTAQVARFYGTFTDASNFERLTITPTSTDARIIFEALGTGSARNIRLINSSAAGIEFWTSNTGRWGVDVNGLFYAVTDNSFDIGATGANRPRNVFLGGYLSSGVLCLTKTASTYAVAAAEKGTEYDNNGAGAQVAFTLPVSVVGMQYTFAVLTAQNLRIAGNGAETIRVAASLSTATTGHIDNATVGGVIRLTCHVAGTWIATYQQGTWTVT